MYGVYLVSGSKYVSSLSEDRSRWSRFVNYNGKGLDCYRDSEEHIKKTIKIAILGGSSSAGFASPLSYTDLLCDSSFNNNQNFEIVNYAENGAPFSGFQAEIVKSVLDYFDVIIVYSGHNEFMNQLYLRDDETVFPNGIPFGNPELVHKGREQKLKNIEYRINPSHTIGYPMMVENSRIHYFIFRIIDRLSRYVKAQFKHAEKETIYPKDFYYSDRFISPAERKNIITHYKKNIIEISNKLKKDQKLILSTVLSNDLFPPLADVYQTSNENELDALNEKLMKIYDFISTNKYKKAREFVNSLPKSAHRYYLEGILCLRISLGSTNQMPIDCFSNLKKARALDAWPGRVLPEINSFIRQFNHENVVSVDPVVSMLKKAKTIDEYMDYFIDFQHPSNLGHAIIAENILNGLSRSNSTSRSYNVRACGIDWKEDGEKKSWNIGYEKCVSHIKINIKWLNQFLKVQPVPYQYDYYKSKSERALIELVGKDNIVN